MEENKESPKIGRPKLEIDPTVVEKLASINCTMIEIASVVGCSVDTLENRFSDIIKKGREFGKMSLRRMMYEKCQQGNVTMMIWLSKQMLGYTDKVITAYDQKIIEDTKKLAELPKPKLLNLVERTLEQSKKDANSS